MEDAPVTIGRILRPHGVCGEVRVLPLTANSMPLSAAKEYSLSTPLLSVRLAV